MRIILIGGGKLGNQLYKSIISNKVVKIIQWVNRSAKKNETSEGVSIVKKASNLENIDLYLLAVTDDSISTISGSLPTDAFVVHTAGSQSLNTISQKRAGVFYPLQSFSKNKDVDFTKISFGIESKIRTDINLLKKLAKSVKASVFEINSQQRQKLHLAAVLVNNFTNHLFFEAAEICKTNDLSFNLLKPIIRETFEKIETLNPQDAQTGPAIRGDEKTIKKHLKLIKSPYLKSIYKLFTSAIQTKYDK